MTCGICGREASCVASAATGEPWCYASKFDGFGAAALYASSHPGASAAEIKTAIFASAVSNHIPVRSVLTGGRLDASSF